MKARVLGGVALVVLGAWVGLSLVLGASAPGSLGVATAEVVGSLLGLGGFALAAVLASAGVAIFRGRRYGMLRGVLDVALVAVCSGLAQLVSDGAGGAVGEAVSEAARAGFGSAGALIALVLLSLLMLAERMTPSSFKQAVKAVAVAKVARKASRSVVEDARVEEEIPGVAVARSQDDAVALEVAEVSRDTEPTPALAPVRAAMLASPSGKVQTRRSLVGAFELPAPGLFEASPAGGGTNEKQLWEEAEALEAALAAYDVHGKVQAVTAGPVVSTFEVSLPAGTKFKKVEGLAGDVGMQFGRKVRVVPSRPGRVGFEVQNEARAAVGIRELLEDPGFEGARKAMSLPFAVGRDVRGKAVFADLATMPHMIVAGSTGSGKSVAVNAMLCSLLAARSPEELRLVLVDPKVVELMPYSGVPHLLAPPVSDVPSATRVLGWCVREMERRYGLLASAGCKSIQSFNGKASRGEKLPFIVVVVDELADLMVQDQKAIEPLLVRLGQKARAAGIHVVVATQRPSVDVVTGLLKSNFPARLAFRVAAAVDSRVVLDEAGAEMLLGKGDALLKSGGDGAVRMQSPWVSEADVEAVAAHLKAQGPARYDASVLVGEEVAAKGDKKGKEGRVWS